METSTAFHFDLGLHPTKDTIKLITSLLEKVISVNDTVHSQATAAAASEATTTKTMQSNEVATPAKHDKQQQPPPPPTTTTTAAVAAAAAAAVSAVSGDSSHQRSSRRMSTPNIYTCFHARSIPSISIQAYLNRILKYCPCTNECFLAILVYFDRMAKPDPPARPIPLRIDSYNVHRLIIAGVMIASKLFSDVFFTNTRYAKVGGLPVSELNVLEVEFLALNEYNLFVTVEEFQYYGDQLLIHWMKEHEGGNGIASTTTTTTTTTTFDNNTNHTTSIDAPSSTSHIDTNTNKDNDVIMTDTTTKRSPASEQEYNTAQMNQAARHLSIDKTRTPLENTSSSSSASSTPSPSLTSNHTTTTPMKDINRKSDEIDQHRLFKRPSSRAVGDIQDRINRTHIAVATNHSIHTPSTSTTTTGNVINGDSTQHGPSEQQQ